MKITLTIVTRAIIVASSLYIGLVAGVGALVLTGTLVLS